MGPTAEKWPRRRLEEEEKVFNVIRRINRRIKWYYWLLAAAGLTFLLPPGGPREFLAVLLAYSVGLGMGASIGLGKPVRSLPPGMYTVRGRAASGPPGRQTVTHLLVCPEDKVAAMPIHVAFPQGSLQESGILGITDPLLVVHDDGTIRLEDGWR